MAEGSFVPRVGNSRKEYTGTITCKAFTTCIIAASGGLLFGYDLGISGGVISMNAFLKKFFPEVYEKQSLVKPSDNPSCKFDSPTLTLFTSSLYIAALFSSLIASMITRELGRRITILTSGCLFAIGALLNGFARNVLMLIIGRMFLGFGIGCANQSVPIYLSEVAPYCCRGAMHMFFQSSIAIGILIANVMNHSFSKFEGDRGWRLSLGLAIVPAIIVIIAGLVLPETPICLIESGKNDKAKQQLMELRGVTNVDQEFADLVAASNESQAVNPSPRYISKVLHEKGINIAVKNPWMNIFKRKYRPQLVFAICIPMFQQLTGINVMVFYAPILLMTTEGIKSDVFVDSAINSVIVVLATAVAFILIDAAGRRFFLLAGGFLMFITKMIGTILIIVAKFEAGSLVVECPYAIGLAWCWGALGWLVPSEIFPLEIRSLAQSINVSVSMLFSFTVAQVFIPMLCHMKLGLLIFFACCMAGMWIFIYVYLPETCGVPIEDMTSVFKNHPRWRKYYDQTNDLGENGASNREVLASC